jgi:hypothetical protein
MSRRLSGGVIVVEQIEKVLQDLAGRTPDDVLSIIKEKTFHHLAFVLARDLAWRIMLP